VSAERRGGIIKLCRHDRAAGNAYPGEHAAIIERPLWDRVHDIIGESPRKRAMCTRAQSPALLKVAFPVGALAAV
jgi:hypothetical protein